MCAFIRLFILFSLSTVAVAQRELNRTSTTCVLSYSSASKERKGIVYKNDKGNIEVCCSKKTPESVIYRSKDAIRRCCHRVAQGYKNSVCYLDREHRPCPGYTCFIQPENLGRSQSIIIDANAPVVKYCPQRPDKRTKGKMIRTDVYQYKLERRCLDTLFNNLIITSKMSTKEVNYRWCCLYDITRNFSSSTKTECCGLSAADAINGGRQSTNQQSPPCCRTQNGLSMCDPQSGDENFESERIRICKPTSGGPDNRFLREDLKIPFPTYYYTTERVTNKVSAATTTYTCNLQGARPEGPLFLYSALDHPLSGPANEAQESVFSISSNAYVNFGLCCPKDIFYEGGEEMRRDCCISYLRMGAPYTKSTLQCVPSGEGSVVGKRSVYRACDPQSCENGILTNRTFVDVTVVSMQKAGLLPLYGVDRYNKNKYRDGKTRTQG